VGGGRTVEEALSVYQRFAGIGDLEAGGHAVAFGRGAVIEIRKVVWPTRKETVNTTLLVMAMVVLVGIILWVFDMFLSWGIQLLTGQGG